MMTVSEELIKMVKHFEGCRLASYQDQGGVWTIGYGHTAGVKEGDTCTQEQAEKWLREDLDLAAKEMLMFVKTDLSQGQFDALTDFAFNLGAASLQRSTLLFRVNAGNFGGAASEFPRWNKVRIDGVLTESPGLTRRRLAEMKMFKGEPWL